MERGDKWLSRPNTQSLSRPDDFRPVGQPKLIAGADRSAIMADDCCFIYHRKNSGVMPWKLLVTVVVSSYKLKRDLQTVAEVADATGVHHQFKFSPNSTFDFPFTTRWVCHVCNVCHRFPASRQYRSYYLLVSETREGIADNCGRCLLQMVVAHAEQSGRRDHECDASASRLPVQAPISCICRTPAL
jgi:hypothetical protein